MKLIKVCAVIAAACALLLPSATPASAAVFNLDVVFGTILTTTIGGIPVGISGSPPCHNFKFDSDTITIDDTGTATTVTAVSITSSVNAGTPSAPYAITFTKHTGSNAGSIASTSPYSMTQNLSLKVEFRTTTSAPSTCTSGTLVCTVQMNFTNSGTSATPLTGNATGHPLTTSTTASLSGSGRVTSILPLPCSAPFATLVSTTVSMTGLDLHVL